MQFLLKLVLTNAIIIACTQLGKKFPTLGGLIATMPLTGALVLVWLHLYHPGHVELITDYS